MNEAKCAGGVAPMCKQPTIDERLERLLSLVHSTADRSDHVYSRLFRDSDPPLVNCTEKTPANCVESKLSIAVDKAEETLKRLESVLDQL